MEARIPRRHEAADAFLDRPDPHSLPRLEQQLETGDHAGRRELDDNRSAIDAVS